MNYHRIYSQIIDRGRERGLPRYRTRKGYERHHIIPRCLGGNDLDDNLVDLTPREHFIAHLMLAKIHGGKLWLALLMMTSDGSKIKHRTTSRQYELIRKQAIIHISDSLKGNKRRRGIPHTVETKLKISKSGKGKKRPWMLLNNNRKGKHHTVESKIKISKNHKGMSGKKQSQKQRQTVANMNVLRPIMKRYNEGKPQKSHDKEFLIWLLYCGEINHPLI